MTANYYSATRDPATGRWTGWVAHAGTHDVTMSPVDDATKRAALQRIRSQHP